MAAPLVSAIMPVYNGERFLEQALDSLLAQDHRPLEVVACDDGSTDRTPAILGSYPIRVVRQENRGAGAARNSAIAASRGEFIAFFDADDLWPRNRVSLQLRHLLDNPGVGCVLGRQEWIEPPPWLTRDAVYGDLGGIPLLSAMIRRGVFDDLGGFDPSFRVAEDTDLLIRMREHGIEIAVLPVVVLTRRFHGGNLTADVLEPQAQVVRALRQKLERARSAPPGRRSGYEPDPQ